MQGPARDWAKHELPGSRPSYRRLRCGWWLVLASLIVLSVPSATSAFHMSQPPEDPLILIVTFTAVLIMMIGVIVAMARGRSRGKLTRKKGSQHLGKGKGRGAFLR